MDRFSVTGCFSDEIKIHDHKTGETRRFGSLQEAEDFLDWHENKERYDRARRHRKARWRRCKRFLGHLFGRTAA